MKRVATFLLAAGLVFAVAAPTLAAPPSSDPTTDAKAAAAWLATKVNASGFIPQTADPDQSESLRLGAGGHRVRRGRRREVEGHRVARLPRQPHRGRRRTGRYRRPGRARVPDPRGRGRGRSTRHRSVPTHTNLVTRLVGTQRSSLPIRTVRHRRRDVRRRDPPGTLVARAAHGRRGQPGGRDVARGSAVRRRLVQRVPRRHERRRARPSTRELRRLRHQLDCVRAPGTARRRAHTAAAAKAVAELDAVRNPAGGWGFASASTSAADPNSTGVVLAAHADREREVSTPRTSSALLAFQVGCTRRGRRPRRHLVRRPRRAPDTFATVQAVPALATATLPITPGTITDGVPTAVAAAATSTTSTTVAASGSRSRPSRRPVRRRAGTVARPRPSCPARVVVVGADRDRCRVRCSRSVGCSSAARRAGVVHDAMPCPVRARADGTDRVGIRAAPLGGRAFGRACAAGTTHVAIVVDLGSGSSVERAVRSRRARAATARPMLAARRVDAGDARNPATARRACCPRSTASRAPAAGSCRTATTRTGRTGTARGGSWSYANNGPASNHADPDVVEGWRWQPEGSARPDRPAARARPPTRARCASRRRRRPRRTDRRPLRRATPSRPRSSVDTASPPRTRGRRPAAGPRPTGATTPATEPEPDGVDAHRGATVKGAR